MTKEEITKEDAINRQAVLDEVNRISVKAVYTFDDYPSLYDFYSNLYDFVAKLPSVAPTENKKIGQWVFNDTANEHAHCSECGHGNVDLVDGKTHNYCECCGAKMEMPENRMSRENAIRYCDEYLATNNVSNIDKEFLRTAKEALQILQIAKEALQKEAKVDE